MDYDNERASFEKIKNMHLETVIAKSANRRQNHPRRNITLQAKRSTKHVIEQRDAARQ